MSEIKFDLGKIYIDGRAISAAEAMDIIVLLQGKNERLERQVKELYRQLTGQDRGYSYIRRELSETS